MLELLNNLSFLDVTEMEASDFCTGLSQVIILLGNIIRLIRWIIPMGLILFGLLDLGKAVIAGKEDEMKKAQGTLIKRVIYAVAVFLVVTLVQLVMGIVDGAETDDTGELTNDSWLTCWNQVSRGELD